MNPVEPTTPKGVTIGEIEARLEASQPSEKRGEPTGLDIYIQYIEDGETQSSRYRGLKDLQQYAGEADFGMQMGGKPHLQEHPQDYWPVDSHVVPVVVGSEIYEIESFWGLITGISDESVIVAPPTGYGYSYGDDYGDGRNPNLYRLSVDIVTLADIDEYANREELLADLSPVLNQM